MHATILPREEYPRPTGCPLDGLLGVGQQARGQPSQSVQALQWRQTHRGKHGDRLEVSRTPLTNDPADEQETRPHHEERQRFWIKVIHNTFSYTTDRQGVSVHNGSLRRAEGTGSKCSSCTFLREAAVFLHERRGVRPPESSVSFEVYTIDYEGPG